MKKIIMFDMDGTLVNSGSMIANTINYVRQNIGLEKMKKDFILKSINDININTSEFFYGTKHFTQEQTVLFEDYYNKNCLNDLEIYDGITNLLEDLDKEFTLAVATNAGHSFATKMLNHLEIGKYFPTILGYDSVSKPKPHPEMINKILQLHDINKINAQVIGDSHKDTQAATSAGVDSVLVNWGFSDHEEDAIETIKELEEKIKHKFKLL